jgi:predicted CXXCH cytochrome family protein
MFGKNFVPILLISGFLICNGLAVEKPTSLQETCVTEECHVVYGQKAHVHAPVELGDCKSCHKPLDPNEHTWQFVLKGKDLCEYCHLEQTTGKNVHEPLKTGDCLECHDPHSSDSSFLITEETVAALCEKCHDTTEGYQFLHGPTAIGECTICHDSHSSDHSALLVTEHSQLCFSCHVVTKDELEKYEFVHEPVLNDCIGCHNPHGANNMEMVKSPAPELCYPCHEDIQKIAENSPYRHSAVTDEGGCTHCHSPHASTVRYLLTKDATSLCMSCHDKPMDLSDGEVLPSLAGEIKNKEFLHGPVADNECSGCHVTHGSEYFRLLVKKYPPIFYAPYSDENYELCFTCHAKSLVTTPETVELTDFRNGSENLHYLHVHKDLRGRTCRACHETHASNLPKLIRESVPYGIWDLPVGFTKTDTGGSCKSGCHLIKEYDRIRPLDYSSSDVHLVEKTDVE